MKKYEYHTQFSYLNEKQLQVYCCALALSIETPSLKETFDLPTSITDKQFLQKNLTFINQSELQALATELLTVVENLVKFRSKPENNVRINFTDFKLLKNYLSKFRYFYWTCRCQYILEDNISINLMDDSLVQTNSIALLALNLFAENNNLN